MTATEVKTNTTALNPSATLAQSGILACDDIAGNPKKALPRSQVSDQYGQKISPRLRVEATMYPSGCSENWRKTPGRAKTGEAGPPAICPMLNAQEIAANHIMMMAEVRRLVFRVS